MAERTLTLRIVVDNSGANAAMQQYNTSLTNAANNHRTLSSTLVSVNDGFNRFNQALNTSVLGISAMDIVRLIGDMNELGQTVTIASQVFTALAGGTEEANEMLLAMQEATGGVVSNLDLMRGAARLLQMGLADSTEEVAGLTEMAIKLGGALGMSTGKALEDFSLMLANVSYLRLDQFGMSAGAVRERVKELREEFPDLSREARFAMAVLEEGQNALNDLGDSADAASTGVNRLETRFDNFFQMMSQRVNAGLEGLANFMDVMIQLELQNMEVRHQTVVTAQAAAHLIGEAWRESFNPDFTDAFFISVEHRIRTLSEELGRMPTLDEFLTNMPAIYGLGPMGFDIDPQELFAINFALEQYTRVQEELTGAYQAQHDTMIALGLASAAYYVQQRQNAFAAYQTQYQVEQAAHQMETAAYNMAYGLAGGAEIPLPDIASILSGEAPVESFAPDVPQFMSPENLLIVQQAYEYMQEQLDEMKADAEEFPDLISEAQIQNAEELTEHMGGIANEAQRAADNLERASLAMLMGQGGGGRVGEMTDDVIEAMRAGGASEEDIAAFQLRADQASGRQTGASLDYQNVLLPLISEMAVTDPEAAVQAMQDFNEIMTALAEADIDPSDVGAVERFVELLLATDPGAMGLPTGDEEGRGGELPPSALESTPISMEDFIQTLIDAGEPVADIAADMETAAEQSGLFAMSAVELHAAMLGARQQSDSLVKNLIYLTANTQLINVRLQLDQMHFRLQVQEAFNLIQMNAR